MQYDTLAPKEAYSEGVDGRILHDEQVRQRHTEPASPTLCDPIDVRELVRPDLHCLPEQLTLAGLELKQGTAQQKKNATESNAHQ